MEIHGQVESQEKNHDVPQRVVNEMKHGWDNNPDAIVIQNSHLMESDSPNNSVDAFNNLPFQESG
eukprot:CAMPEP_0168774194 /NCGR_PEP_ID=MMETSP0725-20121227/4870_1 /TAXON_ID=265536 /ORGANISM="Amphiprora sp., Strain CCMP467" /LENGTH=64 /DNA_ID=CAMNT_0008823783 /DNA_START=209 /DNA_END=403 /DNA_ORIENTATION=+